MGTSTLLAEACSLQPIFLVPLWIQKAWNQDSPIHFGTLGIRVPLHLTEDMFTRRLEYFVEKTDVLLMDIPFLGPGGLASVSQSFGLVIRVPADAQREVYNRDCPQRRCKEAQGDRRACLRVATDRYQPLLALACWGK